MTAATMTASQAMSAAFMASALSLTRVTSKKKTCATGGIDGHRVVGAVDAREDPGSRNPASAGSAGT